MRSLQILPIVLILLATSRCEKPFSTQENDVHLLALKSKCREDGEKVRSEWKKTFFQDTFSDEPEYSFNRALKTCLWIDEYRGPSFDAQPSNGKHPGALIPVETRVDFILDVYTNKALIECVDHAGRQIGNVSKADFDRRKAELLSNR